MYQVLLYSGGIYKFDEFVEFVEDCGGLVLKKDSFYISRGEYYLGEEIRVLIIIPIQEKEKTVKMAQELKGKIETVDLEFEEKSKILSCLVVYDFLNNKLQPLEKEKIDENLTCHCNFQICEDSKTKCFFPDLEGIIETMVDLQLLVVQVKNGKKEYLLKSNEN